MKSHSDSLLHVAYGILEDIHAAYPEYRGVARDKLRLTQLVNNRGLGLFTLLLPERDAQLLRALDTGLLTTSGTTRYSKKYPVPRLFAGLYMRIFDEELRLKDDPDVNAVMFLRQLLCLGKKTEVPCSKKRMFNAIQEYKDVENTLSRPTLKWDEDRLSLDGGGNSLHLRDRVVADLPLFADDPRNPGFDSGNGISALLDRCQHIADILSTELGHYCPDCQIDRRESSERALGLRHGPGAIADRAGGKYSNKYSFTSWPAKLDVLFPFERLGRMPNDERVSPPNREVPAKLICVPKTAKAPRIIAAEPASHMWCQQLTLSWLEDRIKSTFIGGFINLKRQDLSAEMVVQASLDRKLATVDLSSASDRLTCWVVERMFRRNPSLLTALHAHRTRWLHIPDTGDYIRLKKFATQGTAVTFPIQSLVFLIISLAACSSESDVEDGFRRLRGQVRVYGDDIIIPAYGYARLRSLMTYMQLKVNEDKSFVRGHFRESCGQDAYRGYDVTPIKPKTTCLNGPASRVAVLETINNLFYKGYWNASEQLRARQPRDHLSRWHVVGRGAGVPGYGTFMQLWQPGSYGPLSSGRSNVALRGEWLDIGKDSEHQSIRRRRNFLPQQRWCPKTQTVQIRSLAVRERTNAGNPYTGFDGLLDTAVLPCVFPGSSGARIRGASSRSDLTIRYKWEPERSFISGQERG